MSLFVNDDDDNETYVDEGINDVILQQSQTPSLKEEANEEQDPTRPSIPVVFEDPPDITPIYESKEVGCLLPLLFQQEVVEDMLSKDGLLVLGRGLGWEIIAANLLYALSSPSISLVTGDRQESKRSLVLLVNAKEEENIKLSDILTELHWANTTSINRSSPENEGARLSDEYDELTDLDRSPLTIIGGDITSADKRRRTYDCGGIVSVTSRVLVVDLLSGILSPHDITGLFILHAERIKETSNESFIVNLYRDTNDWGFVKAISDKPEAFTGFTPLATNLKYLRLSNVFLWPRFHVEVSSSLTYKGKHSRQQKLEADRSRYVTEINVQLSTNMRKIQSALLACIQSCLQELKRHNPSLATEYWDMENIHDIDFVPRIRISLDSQWHRITWTSKQLVYDLATLKDLLSDLLVVDSLTYYQTVQSLVNVQAKSEAVGMTTTANLQPWLGVPEADTVISRARDRAFRETKISKSKDTIQSAGIEVNDLDEVKEDQLNYYIRNYVLEEQPKWDQLGLLLDDIMYEKSHNNNPRTDGPVLIMCSNTRTAKQISNLIPKLKKEENSMTGKKRFSAKKYMVSKLRDYRAWRETIYATRRIKADMDKQDETGAAGDTEGTNNEELQMSKTFTRGRGTPLSKRRRTRGASSVANVQRLYSGSVQEKNSEPVDLDDEIIENLENEVGQSDDEGDFDIEDDEKIFESIGKNDEIQEVDGLFVKDEGGGFVVGDEDVQEIQNKSQYKSTPNFILEHIDIFDQIIVESYDEAINDALLQEISPAYIIMYEPSLSFIRRVEMYQAINRDTPARTYFMYYGTSVEEQSHLLNIRKEKEAFTKLIREKASLSKNFATEVDNWKFQLQKKQAVNTRIAGGARFRSDDDELQVVVDVREFRSALPNLLYRVGIKVVPCMITVGDYIVSPKICIERKAIPDLISSFKSGRLYTQCEQMFRHYEMPTLLIEFDANHSFSFEPFSETNRNKLAPTNPIAAKLVGQDIQSKIIMLLIAFPKLKIIWSSSSYETAQIFLELKSNQEEPDIASAISKGVDSQIKSNDGGPPMYNDDAIDLLQNIPGINNVNYYNVIQKIRSIEDLVQLPLEAFHELLGQENGNKAFNFISNAVK